MSGSSSLGLWSAKPPRVSTACGRRPPEASASLIHRRKRFVPPTGHICNSVGPDDLKPIKEVMGYGEGLMRSQFATGYFNRHAQAKPDLPLRDWRERLHFLHLVREAVDIRSTQRKITRPCAVC